MKQCPQCAKRFLSDDVRRCDADGAMLQVVIVSTGKDRLVGSVIEGAHRNYQVDSVLGDGGMGVVYRATGDDDGRTYAVKVLRAEYSDETDLVNRFQLEAESVARIDHENIVKVYEFGTLPDGSRYFVMEHLEGKSLGQFLVGQGRIAGTDRCNPLSETDMIGISRQICSGLEAAHTLGIVHRDMKPDNVHLVNIAPGHMRVKILDFGIAKVQGSNAARTRTGSVFGTPHYMSPEQAQGERDIDARTDVYAVGVLMYQMITGRVPFDAENLMGILTAHLYQHPKPIRDVLGMGVVSDGLEAVIFKALAKQRDDRYASMAALQSDLEHVLVGQRPLALDDDTATSRFTADEVADARGWRTSMPPAPGSGAHTVPSGRVSLGPGPTPVPSQAQSMPPPALAAFTQQSIPPVMASAPPRARTSLLVFGLASVGALAFAAAVLFAFRSGESPRAPSGTAPSLVGNTTTQAPVPPPVTVAPALSASIHVLSDPPGATVYRGTTPLGPAPIDVPRPAAGVSDSLTLDQPGRMRTAILLSHDSPAALSVPLGVAAPTPPERTGHAGTHAAPANAGNPPPANAGHGTTPRELLDPWGQR